MKPYTGLIKFSYYFKGICVHQQLLMYKNGYTKNRRHSFFVFKGMLIDSVSYEVVRHENIVIHKQPTNTIIHLNIGQKDFKCRYIEYDEVSQEGRAIVP